MTLRCCFLIEVHPLLGDESASDSNGGPNGGGPASPRPFINEARSQALKEAARDGGLSPAKSTIGSAAIPSNAPLLSSRAASRSASSMRERREKTSLQTHI